MEGFSFYEKQVIIRSNGRVCKTPQELINSDLFKVVLHKFIAILREKRSILLNIFPREMCEEAQSQNLLDLFQKLAYLPKEEIIKTFPHLAGFFQDTYLLNQFVENLYNYWRSFERFLICYSGADTATSHDKRPYRTFNETIEQLNHLVRKVYRDICENTTHQHLSVYRQLHAGCQVGLIVTETKWPSPYKQLKGIPFIKQVLLEPPLIIDPPMNKRKGQFKRINTNPLTGIKLNKWDWLCYPAKVGNLIIHIFFHNTFISLGTALANLFELASNEELKKKPDAIYIYGAPYDSLKRFGEIPTVFYDNKKEGTLIAAVPGTNEFGYFGYLKKMTLTLHNIIMMKRGRLPLHGAMVKILLKNGKSATLVVVGDTGTGKSETLEAFRVLSEKYLRDMTIIFDDMGSLGFTKDGEIKAYGTETGAFVRLDDLQPGFAFGNIDRSIIMSPQKTNARALLPITTLKEVLHGYKVDFLLYANNYENVNNNRPFFEEFSSVEKALKVFRKGARIAKGTTEETGLVRSYFANIFGPPQYRTLHEKLAKKYFKALFNSGTKLGQLRTRLGIAGYETKGPETAAKALFEVVSKN